MRFGVKFWGVRGSIACASPQFMTFGGNTSCIELSLGSRTVILDAGTGIRELGNDLAARSVREAAILLTHTHWDHICGFPFFAPGYDPRCSFSVMGGHMAERGGLRNVFSHQMSFPLFPVPLGAMKADLSFVDFHAGDAFALADDVHVKTAPLSHPDGAIGYRVEHGGRSLCYVTDTEHKPGRPDENVLGLIEGADLLIYDCTYTDDEFPAKVGWGHSTWQEGVRLAQAAGVGRLAVFHHDPDRDDAAMAEIDRQARRTWNGAFVARDGMVLDLGA